MRYQIHLPHDKYVIIDCDSIIKKDDEVMFKTKDVVEALFVVSSIVGFVRLEDKNDEVA